MRYFTKPTLDQLEALLCILIMVILLASCSAFSPQVRTSLEEDLPRDYSVDMLSQQGERTQQWWEDFRAPELDTLVGQALSGNFTLQEAWARLRQAQALAVQTGANLYPDLNVTAGGSTARQRTDSGSGGSTSSGSSYSLGIASSYELDLWGKIRAEEEAAVLEAQASREDYSAAAMTVAAQVTEDWINLVSQRMQKQILLDQLETNRTYLELTQLRYRKSLASAVDVYQQRQLVEQVEAQLPLVEAAEATYLNELTLLLGKPQGSYPVITSDKLPSFGELPSTGLPADLLVNRPDVCSAGLRLMASDWQVAVARADRLPAISLSASALYSAESLDLIFDNWILSLAGNLAAPVFDAGRRSSEVERTTAVVDENLAAYRRTVYTAVKEVEDALVREEKTSQYVRGLQQQTATARLVLEEARLRYTKGITDYLPVLTALRSVQGLETSLVDQQTQLLINRVNLYRALGGTWTDEISAAQAFLTTNEKQGVIE